MSENTINVRTTRYAILLADQALARANNQRAKIRKAPLSKSKAIEIALENVTIKKLIDA